MPWVGRQEKFVITVFIIISTLVFVTVGNPVRMLVFAGAVNGFILPIALAVILIASRRSTVVQQYKHPAALQIAGWLVVGVMSWMSLYVMWKYLVQQIR